MSLYFSLIYFLLWQFQKDMQQCDMKKRKVLGGGRKSWDVKNDGCDLPNCLEISVYVCTHVSFHQSLAFCFGDYMHQGTNDRNLTISRLDYREDDRRGEWEGGRGISVCYFLQIWYDTAVCWAEMKMFPGFDWQTEDRMVCILSVNIILQLLQAW